MCIRDSLQAAQGHVVAVDGRAAGQRQRRQPPRQRAQGDLPLQTGQWRAQAVVDLSLIHILAGFQQGYDRTPQSAAAMLDFLAARFPLNKAMVAAIRKLL